MLFVHISLGGAFPKRHRANCGVIAVIRKVPILGRHTLGVRGSIRALSFHACLEPDRTNSKKSKKCETFEWRHFM
jgi:hypothetical protein